MKKVCLGLKVSTDLPAMPLSVGGVGHIIVDNHQRFGNFHP
jgi:hypothetical protein